MICKCPFLPPNRGYSLMEARLHLSRFSVQETFTCVQFTPSLSQHTATPLQFSAVTLSKYWEKIGGENSFKCKCNNWANAAVIIFKLSYLTFHLWLNNTPSKYDLITEWLCRGNHSFIICFYCSCVMFSVRQTNNLCTWCSTCWFLTLCVFVLHQILIRLLFLASGSPVAMPLITDLSS